MEFPVRFGKYELLDRIAMGGMAEVFLARSFGVEGFEKNLVIKRILPGLARSPRFVNMFIKEAKITAGLAHPNIVQTYELGRVGDDHYIAMEYVHGQDLTHVNRALRKEQFRMPLGLAVYTTALVLRGLGFAHSLVDANGKPLNLIHRDVSPHNVMVSFQGEVKIFDFGIARLLGDTLGQENHSVPGGGKFAYMSPEQASGRAMGPQSDIYSAGVMLYEMLVGRRLFKHDDPAEKLRMVREAEVPDPREQHPDIPDALWSILRNMLDKDPEKRPAKAGLVEEELWGFLFAYGVRTGALEMKEFVRDLFPSASEMRPTGVDLEGLAEDLARLENRESATKPDPSSRERSLLSLSNFGSDGDWQVSDFGALGDESKTVAVLAVEVYGFTEPSRLREPDTILRWQKRLRKKFEVAIQRFGGKVVGFEGDHFLVLFGVPRAEPHDLERAVACADTLRRVARRVDVDGGRAGLSIGVHRGEIAVAKEVDQFRFLSRGNTVKWARRLSLEAQEGEVLVSAAVERLAGKHFYFQPVETKRTRAAATDGLVHRLVGAQAERARGAGRWLRRGDELSVFASALARLNQGGRTLLEITGEAGTGKTWLVHELSRLARSRGLQVYVGRAPPYVHDRPLSSFRELLAQILGVEIGDSADEITERMERLSQLGLSESQREVIGTIFGLQSRGGREAGVQSALVQAMIEVVRGVCRERPVILALENAEYLSATERNLVRALIGQTEDCQLMLLFTARQSIPEEVGRTDYRIRLTALDDDAQLAMIGNILSVDSVEPALLQKIRATTEGNPMYLEAVLTALVNSGRARIVDGVLCPGSGEEVDSLPLGLDGLIASRVDALGSTEKGALQIASLVGLTFGSGMLSTAIGSDSLDHVLRNLVEAGLIRAQPDGRYAFVSTLVWEVVDRSILGQRRRDYHLMVAFGIERYYSGHLDVHRQVLAKHWAAAGRYDAAAREGERAGSVFMRQQLLEPAATCWELALDWLKESKSEAVEGEIDSVGLEARIRRRAGQSRRMLGELRKAEVHLHIALDLAVDMGLREVEAETQLELGRLYRAQSRGELAAIHFEAAQQVADTASVEALVDGPDWARQVAVSALEGQGILCREAGRMEESSVFFESALTIAGDNDLLAAQALLGLASSRHRVEDFSGALELLGSALAKARAGNDRILMARILNNTGITHHIAGRYEEALLRYREAGDLYRSVGYPFGLVVALHNVGDSHLRLGNHGRAWAAFEESRALAEQVGLPIGTILNEPFMAYIEALRAVDTRAEGEEGAEPYVARIEAMAQEARRMGDVETAVIARGLIGKTHRAFGQSEKARAALLLAMEGARELDSAPMLHEFEQDLSLID